MPHLGKVLADLGAHLLIDLQDLQLGFRHFAFGLCDRGDKLTALSPQPLLFPLGGE